MKNYLLEIYVKNILQIKTKCLPSKVSSCD